MPQLIHIGSISMIQIASIFILEQPKEIPQNISVWQVALILRHRGQDPFVHTSTSSMVAQSRDQYKAV